MDEITLKVTRRQLTLIRVACLQRLDRLKDREDCRSSYNETRDMLDAGGALDYRGGKPAGQ